MRFLATLFTALVFTTSVFASNIDNNSDNETTTSIEATSQKKSGQVVYNCGDTPCEGFKKAFHKNGQLQISGTFENGIAVDTLKEFDAAGQMMRLFLPNTDNGFEMQFYPDGQIKRVYENNTDKCTYYYNNGNVWLTYTHNAGTRTNVTQYYENGQVRLTQKGNKQVVYYADGRIAYEFKRKVTAKKGDVALYAYTYEAFNQVSVKVTAATFTATSMDFKNGFPLDFSDVADKDFNEVIYFDEVGNPLKKVENIQTSNSRYNKVTSTYNNGKWEKTESLSVKVSK